MENNKINLKAHQIVTVVVKIPLWLAHIAENQAEHIFGKRKTINLLLRTSYLNSLIRKKSGKTILPKNKKNTFLLLHRFIRESAAICKNDPLIENQIENKKYIAKTFNEIINGRSKAIGQGQQYKIALKHLQNLSPDS